jgi:gamma-glutamyltranspeptidase / glutathione hydrolase
MTPPVTRIAHLVALTLLPMLLMRAGAMADTFTGERYVAATVNPLATDAAVDVFEDGGNAVDAAIAAALTLAVVDGHNSGIGGGCLILIRTADGHLVAIDGREKAPAAATADMFIIDGTPSTDASQVGPLASGVPGALAAYEAARERCGSKPLKRLIEPGLRAAREGFVIDEHLGGILSRAARKLGQFDGSRAVYFKRDDEVYAAGDLFVQADLARTLENVANHGVDWFYRGELAQTVGAWMQDHRGYITAADFADYQAEIRPPIVSTYRGYTVVGFPPPSSGGVHVAQALNMLEGYDLAQIFQNSPTDAVHLIGEVFSRVFADRAYWLGDADHAPVPRGLLDKQYARELAQSIDRKRAVEVPHHGTPPLWNQDLFGRHTTHITAADAAGNWVAITATVNTTFGSGVVVPGTGVVLNNEMDDFSIHPGEPNAFGLIGAENNAIAPGKRPLSSMSPTIVLDGTGQPQLTIGAAGGPKIITQVLLGIIRYIDLKQPIDRAVEAPRFHHQWRPNQLGLETTVPRHWADDLVARGHHIRTLPSAGVTQAIARDEDGKLIAVADPRVPGKASGR